MYTRVKKGYDLSRVYDSLDLRGKKESHGEVVGAESSFSRAACVTARGCNAEKPVMLRLAKQSCRAAAVLLLLFALLLRRGLYGLWNVARAEGIFKCYGD